MSAGRERPLVILNPRSGGGRAGRTATEVRAVIERRLGVVDFAVTERPGHGIDLAHDAAQRGCDLIIAVGGDGTLHEVANGVLDAGGAASVGYVGQGTGGDFRRTLGLEHRLDVYVEAIASGRTRRIDVGKVRYRAVDGSTRSRWFVNILSAGMGGLVDRYVAQTTRALGGRSAYFLAAVRALARCRRGHLRCGVTLRGEHREVRIETLMLAICNGSHFGGGMHVAPMAKPDDARFEVIAMDAQTKLAFATFSTRIYRGLHLSAAGVTHFGCDAISLDLENEAARDVFLVDVDGELVGGLPLHVELVPSALLLRV